MKKVFSKLMTIIFAVSLALFMILGIVVIIAGPQKTENAIKALFKYENYKENYKKIFPFLSIDTEKVEEEKTANTLGVFSKREITDRSEVPPFIVPSSGIAPSSKFLYTGLLSEGKHEGIDIWTNLNGTGLDGKTFGKGSPVYASCDGWVRTVWNENGDVSVICDPLDPIYIDQVPSLTIKTLYGHMANQFSDEVYIYVNEGQIVKKGDLIGHQGNRCFWAPKNTIVHLHFAVYDITNPANQIPLDPEPYIGVSCTTLGQEYIAGVNE
ncbi:M23 family metallopeptidase [Patescibacteria group bacterium]